MATFFERLNNLLKKKPLMFSLATIGYLAVVILLKWRLSPTIASIWFALGGVIGIYFLDVAEEFFKLTPSPFRTIVFCAGFAIVSFFVVTSSGSSLATGLVLSIYITLILWIVGEWRLRGSIDSWWAMVAGSTKSQTQRVSIILFCVGFVVETFLFVR